MENKPKHNGKNKKSGSNGKEKNKSAIEKWNETRKNTIKRRIIGLTQENKNKK